jgi:hypothetical protein
VHGDGPVLWTTYPNHGHAAGGRDFIDVVHHLAERAGVGPAPIGRPRPTAERKAPLLHAANASSSRSTTTPAGAARTCASDTSTRVERSRSVWTIDPDPRHRQEPADVVRDGGGAAAWDTVVRAPVRAIA